MVIYLSRCQLDSWKTICRMTIQIARLCVLITLFIIILFRRVYLFTRRDSNGAYEENKPLLAGSDQAVMEEHLHSFERVEGEQPDTQTEIPKMWNTFKRVIPFLWPKDNAKLQLQCIGTFLCMGSKRV